MMSWGKTSALSWKECETKEGDDARRPIPDRRLTLAQTPDNLLKCALDFGEAEFEPDFKQFLGDDPLPF